MVFLSSNRPWGHVLVQHNFVVRWWLMDLDHSVTKALAGLSGSCGLVGLKKELAKGESRWSRPWLTSVASLRMIETIWNDFQVYHKEHSLCHLCDETWPCHKKSVCLAFDVNIPCALARVTTTINRNSLFWYDRERFTDIPLGFYAFMSS